IEEHQEDLVHQTGKPIAIEKILVRDLLKERPLAVDPDLLTNRPEEIVQNDRVDLVVEVMGGIEPTRGYLREALENGKHVVTANKDLMAAHGAELLSIAAQRNCDVYYEASVAG